MESSGTSRSELASGSVEELLGGEVERKRPGRVLKNCASGSDGCCPLKANCLGGFLIVLPQDLSLLLLYRLINQPTILERYKDI